MQIKNNLTTKSRFLKIPAVLQYRNLQDIWSSMSSHPGLPFFLFLLGLTLAEFITAVSVPQVGLVLHGLLLLATILLAAFSEKKVQYRFYLVMALAPLVRLLSLSMPLLQFEFVNWYMVIGVPLFIATFIALRMAGYKSSQVGLTFGRKWWLQGIVILLGFGLGFLEYWILRPDPLVDSFGWQQVVYPALILLIFTGFMEELIFRGLMQRASLQSLGRIGFIYTAAVFAVLHIGYKSILDVIFVFAVGFLFAHIVQKTNAIWGVTLSHAITNISLFLVFPFLFAVTTPTPQVPPPPETNNQVIPPTDVIPTSTPDASQTNINKLGPIYVPLEKGISPNLEATPTAIPSTPTLQATATATASPIPTNTIPPTYPPPPTAIPTLVLTSTPVTQPTDTPAPTSTPTPLPTETPAPSSTLAATSPPTNTPFPTIIVTSPPTKTFVPTNTVPPTNTPLPPTNTPIPTNTVPPTNTPLPPTATPIPTNTIQPTNTQPPPTDTHIPTNTLPPTNTPPPPTDTPIPTNTLPPTNTPIPPTDDPQR
jgi:membrane protease YdiL (CAAX protease family)